MNKNHSSTRSYFRLILALMLLGTLTSVAWAQMDAGAAALLQKVTDAYRNAASFSSDGHYENDLQTAHPFTEKGTFKILFVRPDLIRVDWTDTKLGGDIITSSVFTRDKTVYFLFGDLNKVSPEQNMEMALGAAAGVSHGISYGIPTILRGKNNYYTFETLQPPVHTTLNGKDCLVLKGTTKLQGDLTLAVDPSTNAIYQIEQHQLIKPGAMQKEMTKLRAKLAQTNPTLAAKLHDIPVQPDFTSVQITTFDTPVFGKTLVPADFVYPVPDTVTKVDNVVK